MAFANSIGRATDTAGTPWFAVVPGHAGYYTWITALQVKSGATNNGLYVMRALAGATVLSAQAAGDTTLVLDANPSPDGNTIASGDEVVYLASDGTYRRTTVSSWNGSTLTLTVGALPAAVAADSPMWNFGVYTDTEPATSLAFPLVDTPVSVTTPYAFVGGFGGWGAGEPLLVYCPNATNQTVLNYLEYAAG